MTTRQQLEKAKDLIQQRRYPEARRLLSALDDPTAVRWLAKLDAMNPPAQSRLTGFVLGAISLLTGTVGMLILIGLGVAFVRLQNGAYRGNVGDLLPWALAVLVLLPAAYVTRKMRS